MLQHTRNAFASLLFVVDSIGIVPRDFLFAFVYRISTVEKFASLGLCPRASVSAVEVSTLTIAHGECMLAEAAHTRSWFMEGRPALEDAEVDAAVYYQTTACVDLFLRRVISSNRFVRTYVMIAAEAGGLRRKL